jgi:hypothetical protein
LPTRPTFSSAHAPLNIEPEASHKATTAQQDGGLRTCCRVTRWPVRLLMACRPVHAARSVLAATRGCELLASRVKRPCLPERVCKAETEAGQTACMQAVSVSLLMDPGCSAQPCPLCHHMRYHAPRSRGSGPCCVRWLPRPMSAPCTLGMGLWDGAAWLFSGCSARWPVLLMPLLHCSSGACACKLIVQHHLLCLPCAADSTRSHAQRLMAAAEA